MFVSLYGYGCLSGGKR